MEVYVPAIGVVENLTVSAEGGDSQRVPEGRRDTVRCIRLNGRPRSFLQSLPGLSINRLRRLLLQIPPALERVFAGTRLTNQLSLDLLAHYGGSTGLCRAGAG